MNNWPDSSELSDVAVTVARRIGSDWRAVAHAVELCVECGTPIAVQGSPGQFVTRAESLAYYAKKAGKEVDELDDLERRLAVLGALLHYTRPGVSQGERKQDVISS